MEFGKTRTTETAIQTVLEILKDEHAISTSTRSKRLFEACVLLRTVLEDFRNMAKSTAELQESLEDFAEKVRRL